jgi:hypothetical protein
VKNEIRYEVKEDRNILHTIRSGTNWISHILRRSCLLTYIIEGRRYRRRQKLLDDIKEETIMEIEGDGGRSHYVENSL